MPMYWWKDVANQCQKLDEVGTKLNVKQLDDWYKVKYVDFLACGGTGLMCASIFLFTNNYG
jgi:hypothetical protein